MKTYSVVCTLEVNADSKEEAEQEAIEDIKVLVNDGSLNVEANELT